MSFPSRTLPSFWGVIRSLPVELLLHVYVPPSHCDGYQGKAFLQRPRVHHGFYIKAFLLPVLMETEETSYRTTRPSLTEDQACAHRATTCWQPLWSFSSPPSSAHQPPPSPHCVLPWHSPQSTDCLPFVLFLYIRRSHLKSRYFVWFYWAHLGLGTPHWADTWVNGGREGRQSGQAFNNHVTTLAQTTQARWGKNCSVNSLYLPKW